MPDSDIKQPKGIFAKFLAWLRSNFFAGLLVILPISITVVLIRFIVETLDGLVSSLFPQKYALANYLPYDVFGVEILLGGTVLVLIGMLTKNYAGAAFMRWLERMVKKIPGVRGIYNAVKQIIDTVTRSNSESFREVVLVEYPRPGMWAIAFLTGKTAGEVQKLHEDEMVNVFLPTTPNPTSGFLLFVPRKDVIKLHMSVDQGIKMVISAGMVTPTIAEGKAALKEAKEEVKADTIEAGDGDVK